MSGTDFVFNIAKGKWGYYAGLPAANDALIIIPLETTGLETDAILRDKDTFTDVVLGTTNEQTTLGRKTVTAAVSYATDDTNDKTWVDITTDPVWTASAGNAIAKLVVCYDPDTTGGTDTDLIPLFCLSCDFTPDGSDLTAVINASGIGQAT
jgi:hypothetical protein